MSKRYPCARCGTSPEGCAACPQVAEHYVMERHRQPRFTCEVCDRDYSGELCSHCDCQRTPCVCIERQAFREGSRVRFKAHGETGLIHTVITREGDDCDLCDPRGRILPRVPIELLVLAPAEPKLSAIRAVDELR